MENYQPIDGYVRKAEYSNDNYNQINNKSTTISVDEIVMSGEANSQYIPFTIPRYYDGVDLSTKQIQVHYVNKNDEGDYSDVINAEYNDDTVRFGWLVPKSATLVDGDLQVGIEITGVNTLGEEYIWKSKIVYMTVNKALATGAGIVEPGEEWYATFTNTVRELKERIRMITTSEGKDAELKDARRDYYGEDHETLKDRLDADLEKMYAKKNYEVLNRKDNKPFSLWIGSKEEFEKDEPQNNPNEIVIKLNEEEDIPQMLAMTYDAENKTINLTWGGVVFSRLAVAGFSNNTSGGSSSGDGDGDAFVNPEGDKLSLSASTSYIYDGASYSYQNKISETLSIKNETGLPITISNITGQRHFTFDGSVTLQNGDTKQYSYNKNYGIGEGYESADDYTAQPYTITVTYSYDGVVRTKDITVTPYRSVKND